MSFSFSTLITIFLTRPFIKSLFFFSFLVFRFKSFTYLPTQSNQPFSEKQLQTYRMIKSLYDKGLSYRRITKQLNDKGITTNKGNQWGVSGNSVYSVLKRYKEREGRLKHKNKKYEPVFSKMWVE